MSNQVATNLKQPFLDFLAENGYKETWMYDQLDFLIAKSEDYDDFVKNFWDGDLDNLRITVSNFRKHMLDKKKMSFTQFVQMYASDKRKALERLFQHRVPTHLLELLQKRNITQEQVYQFSQENQGRPLHILVL